MGFAKGKFCGYETIIANGKTLMSKTAKTLKTNKKSIREVRYKTAKFPKSTSSHYKTAKSANSAKSSSIKFATLTALRHAKGVVTQET